MNYNTEMGLSIATPMWPPSESLVRPSLKQRGHLPGDRDTPPPPPRVLGVTHVCRLIEDWVGLFSGRPRLPDLRL